MGSALVGCLTGLRDPGAMIGVVRLDDNEAGASTIMDRAKRMGCVPPDCHQIEEQQQRE